jgi:Pyruvate/2-oxoacid:ferredoxin oxidoreductase gamma subunit
VTDLADIDSMTSIVRKKFEGKFAKPIIEGNVKAMKRAYEEVKTDK